MEQGHALVIQKLVSEQNIYQWQLFWGTLVILVLMVVSLIASRVKGWEDLVLLVVVLGVMWPFMMARFDFLIHRTGGGLAQYGFEWEYSPVRMHRRGMLLVYDAGTAIVILYLWGRGMVSSWKLGKKVECLVAGVLFLVGIGLLLEAPRSFDKFKTP